MTIERESRRSDVYLGDGRNTSLPFGFKVFLPTEIVVVLNENGVERTLSHGRGCTVSLNAEQDVQPGGTVRLDAPLPTGSKAVVLSNVRPLQQVDLTNQGGFYPDVLNAVHDRLTMLIQQLMELQDRTPQVPATDNVTGKELARQIVELSRSLPEALRLLTSEEFKKLLKLIKANPNLGGVELSSAVDSVREDVAATSKAVKTAYDKAVEAEAAAASAEGAVNNVSGKLAAKLDTSVFEEFKSKAVTQEELEEKVGAAQSQVPGKIELLPFPADALPKRWYHANGDKYHKDSLQGKALLSLPEAYRTAFKIAVSGDEVNLPNLYHSDGRGYFFRASKVLGEVQGDAMAKHYHASGIGYTSGFGLFFPRNASNGNYELPIGQAMHGQMLTVTSGQPPAVVDHTWWGSRSEGFMRNLFTMDTPKQKSGANGENRPLNIGFTPAIYLGV